MVICGKNETGGLWQKKDNTMLMSDGFNLFERGGSQLRVDPFGAIRQERIDEMLLLKALGCCRPRGGGEEQLKPGDKSEQIWPEDR